MEKVVSHKHYSALSQEVRDAVSMGKTSKHIDTNVFLAYDRAYLAQQYAGVVHSSTRVTILFAMYLPEIYDFQTLYQMGTIIRSVKLTHEYDYYSLQDKVPPPRSLSVWDEYRTGLPRTGIENLAVRSPRCAQRPLKIIDRNSFYEQYKNGFGRILHVIEGENKACWAGGMLNKMLTSADTRGSDIDIFIMENDGEVFTRVVENISAALANIYQGKKIYYVPKSAVLNIHVSETSLAIQVVMTSASSPRQVVNDFDWSHCAVYMHMGEVCALIPWFEATYTNITRNLSVGSNVDVRIIKAWFNGYSIDDRAPEKILAICRHLQEQFSDKKNPPLLDKLAAQLLLTEDDRTNRYILSLHYGGDVVMENIKNTLELIDFDADIAPYTSSAICLRMFEKIMSNHIISPSKGENTLACLGRKPCVLVARGLVVREILRLDTHSSADVAHLRLYFEFDSDFEEFADYMHKCGFRAFTGLTPPADRPPVSLVHALRAHSTPRTPQAPRAPGNYIVTGDKYVPIKVGDKIRKVYFHILLHATERYYSLRIISIHGAS